MRRTKIIATLGPATDPIDTLEALLAAGVNIVRINFSHGDQDAQRDRIAKVQACARKLNKIVGVLIDLQGPKIRIARFHNEDGVILSEGDAFCLDASLDKVSGDATKVGLDYPTLPDEVKENDELLLDDGRIVLTVQQILGTQVHCRVKVGG